MNRALSLLSVVLLAILLGLLLGLLLNPERLIRTPRLDLLPVGDCVGSVM